MPSCCRGIESCSWFLVSTPMTACCFVNVVMLPLMTSLSMTSATQTRTKRSRSMAKWSMGPIRVSHIEPRPRPPRYDALQGGDRPCCLPVISDHRSKVTVNTLRLRQNGLHFPDDILKWIFLNENIWILIKISLKFVPGGPINNIPALVQIMAWRRPGDKPLSEPITNQLYLIMAQIPAATSQMLWLPATFQFLLGSLIGSVQILCSPDLIDRTCSNPMQSRSHWSDLFKSYAVKISLIRPVHILCSPDLIDWICYILCSPDLTDWICSHPMQCRSHWLDLFTSYAVQNTLIGSVHILCSADLTDWICSHPMQCRSHWLDLFTSYAVQISLIGSVHILCSADHTDWICSHPMQCRSHWLDLFTSYAVQISLIGSVHILCSADLTDWICSHPMQCRSHWLDLFTSYAVQISRIGSVHILCSPDLTDWICSHPMQCRSHWSDLFTSYAVQISLIGPVHILCSPDPMHSSWILMNHATICIDCVPGM